MRRYQKTFINIMVFSFLSLILIKFLVNSKIPDSLFMDKKQEINLHNIVPFADIKIKPQSKFINKINKVLAFKFNKLDFKANATFFSIPIKSVDVKIKERKNVIPCGLPFGIKVFTNGLMVIKTSLIETNDGDINPGEMNDIKFGDIITKVNDKEINFSDEFIQIIENSNGNSIKITINRNFKQINKILKPVKSAKDEVYKLGIWVRESSAGIGTMTFIDPEAKTFLGLGHGIRDENTKILLPILNGEILSATINSVRKSINSYPGELRGSITSKIAIGNLYKNVDNGIFGTFKDYEKALDIFKLKDQNPLPIAFKQEIELGKAFIFLTLSGCNPEKYEILVKNIDYINKIKNMVIEIVDDRLLKLSGGITKGMSGSPIIQNQKLIGALNHVIVNDPSKGYAIFAESLI